MAFGLSRWAGQQRHAAFIYLTTQGKLAAFNGLLARPELKHFPFVTLIK
jgi:hypothetical protein